MPDQALFLLLQQPAEAVQLLIGLQHVLFDPVDQIVIKITGPGLFQLGVEHLIPVFLCLNEAGVQLGGQGEAFPRIAADQCFLRTRFTRKRIVHPGCIKVGKAFFHEQVDHVLQLFDIDICRIVRVILRQPHQTESEFLFRNEFHIFALP